MMTLIEFPPRKKPKPIAGERQELTALYVSLLAGASAVANIDASQVPELDSGLIDSDLASDMLRAYASELKEHIDQLPR